MPPNVFETADAQGERRLVYLLRLNLTHRDGLFAYQYLIDGSNQVVRADFKVSTCEPGCENRRIRWFEAPQPLPLGISKLSFVPVETGSGPTLVQSSHFLNFTPVDVSGAVGNETIAGFATDSRGNRLGVQLELVSLEIGENLPQIPAWPSLQDQRAIAGPHRMFYPEFGEDLFDRNSTPEAAFHVLHSQTKEVRDLLNGGCVTRVSITPRALSFYTLQGTQYLPEDRSTKQTNYQFQFRNGDDFATYTVRHDWHQFREDEFVVQKVSYDESPVDCVKAIQRTAALGMVHALDRLHQLRLDMPDGLLGVRFERNEMYGYESHSAETYLMSYLSGQGDGGLSFPSTVRLHADLDAWVDWFLPSEEAERLGAGLNAVRAEG